MSKTQDIPVIASRLPRHMEIASLPVERVARNTCTGRKCRCDGMRLLLEPVCDELFVDVNIHLFQALVA